MDIKRRVYADAELHSFSTLALAHVGDAVYELFARTHVCENGKLTARTMHKATVEFVSATAQAAAYKRIEPHLSDGERDVCTRGRNAHSRAPKNADAADYRCATGLEALFGYLYLTGRTERAAELFALGNG